MRDKEAADCTFAHYLPITYENRESGDKPRLRTSDKAWRSPMARKKLPAITI